MLRRRLRAFSLIEVMVVVAIISVFVALAAPNLLIEVQKANLAGETDEVAAFLARAQTEAMVSRRCVRVTFSGTNNTTMIAERLNVFDCDNIDAAATGFAKGIDGSALPGALWLQFQKRVLSSSRIKVIFDNAATDGEVVPHECGGATTAPGSAAGTVEIRFRPNGRVFSNDGTATAPNLGNDDAIVVLKHLDITSTSNTKMILVNGNGLMCVGDRGNSATANFGPGPDFNCP